MMKITGTRSYIRVEINEKIVKIDGEMIVGGFVAPKDSIKKWEVPDAEVIDEQTKQEIINKVLNETKNSHMIISFE